jgi:hypothetical protein
MRRGPCPEASIKARCDSRHLPYIDGYGLFLPYHSMGTHGMIHTDYPPSILLHITQGLYMSLGSPSL